MNVYRIAGSIVVSAVIGCSVYKGEGAEVGAGSLESSLSDSNDSNDSNDSISTSSADSSDETTSAGGETTGNSSEMVEMRMTPPATLSLDSQNVAQGNFTLTQIIAYSATLVETEILAPPDPPLVFFATIGTIDYHSLFGAPADTEVLQMVGFFDAVAPDLPPVDFSVTLFGELQEPTEFTVFLPMETSEALCHQVTGTGLTAALGDNVDVFCGAALTSTDVADIKAHDPVNPGTVNTLLPPLSECTCDAPRQPHGTGSSSGIGNGSCGYQCSDGTCVDANVACNGTQDCPDGSDEDPSICDSPSSCCVATNGCPEETGADCGTFCCCCPGGEACCQNPINGCCPSP